VASCSFCLLHDGIDFLFAMTMWPIENSAGLSGFSETFAFLASAALRTWNFPDPMYLGHIARSRRSQLENWRP
jgi:hypothetical protein